MSDTNTSDTEQYPKVEGECPECGSHGLFVAEGGYVTCPRIGCPDPTAPSKALGVRGLQPATERGEDDG